ncbi:MAG: antibiotic biosynthesis monooxygenase [Anaerolineae bacterium]|nr:antibiotic biosynthesis monooxygenase [Anaerolineae bacterium]
MFAVLVQIHVKSEFVDAFIEATLDNCRNSVHEPGIATFDLLRAQDDPACFSLYEIYHMPEAQLAHRETAHYLRWREAVEPMMAEPRTFSKLDVLFHEEG